MANFVELNSSNWIKFFNKKLCFVMFSKSNCKQCETLEAHILAVETKQEIPLTKLTLDTPGFAELKRNYPWISRIDTLPFNAIFSEGKLIDSWSGSSIETLQHKLKEISS